MAGTCGLAERPGGQDITLVPPGDAQTQVLALAGRVPYSPGRPRLWLSLIRYLVRHDLIRLLLVLLTLIAFGCCLLVLFGTEFRRLEHSHPEVAAQIKALMRERLIRQAEA